MNFSSQYYGKGNRMRLSCVLLAGLVLLGLATAVLAQPAEGLYHSTNTATGQTRHFIIYDTGYWYEVAWNEVTQEWEPVEGRSGTWAWDPDLSLLGLFNEYDDELYWWDCTNSLQIKVYDSETGYFGPAAGPDPLPPGW